MDDEAKNKKTDDAVSDADVTIDSEISDIEPTDEEGTALSAGQKLKDLRDKLKKCEAEKLETLAGWQRMKAETINARKRDEERQKEMILFANENLIMELLPVLDSFEMAKANKEAWEKVDKNWRVGIEYIQSQILAILAKNNLVEVNPIGADYSPTEHEAIEMVEVKDEAQDGKIIEVVNKGYKLNDHVIRAPKVKVGERKS